MMEIITSLLYEDMVDSDIDWKRPWFLWLSCSNFILITDAKNIKDIF